MASEHFDNNDDDDNDWWYELKSNDYPILNDEINEEYCVVKIKCRWIVQNWNELFGMVSLFNGISTFVGYLMPKPSF